MRVKNPVEKRTQMETSEFLFTPDLSEAVESTPVPPGIYTARVTSLEKRVSKTESATPYIKWELTLFGCEGELTKHNNWKVYTNTMLAGKGTGILKSFYKACTKEEIPDGAINWALLVGSEVQVTLREGQPYNGEPSKYPEVASVKPITQ